MPRSTWKVPTGEGRQTAASQAREAWAESRERPVTPCQLTQLDRQPAAAASRVDGTGNRFFGSCAQQAQLRELRRTRPFGRGFPSSSASRRSHGSRPQQVARRITRLI
jgi:hypothetical protein